MKPKQIDLKDFISNNRRKVQLENLNAKQGFTFEDDKLLAIRKKIEAAGVPLGEIEGVSLRRGIQTSCNEAFIIDEVKAREIIRKEKRCKEFIKKVLRGMDLSRYGITENTKYMIVIPKGFTDSNRKDVAPYEFVCNEVGPIIEHLEDADKNIKNAGGNARGKGAVKNRTDMGDYWWELRACGYYDEMVDMLCWSRISQDATFVWCEGEQYITNSVQMLKYKKAKSFTAIFNTNVFNRIYKKFWAVSIIGGIDYAVADTFKNVVEPYELVNREEELEDYVDQIQSLKKQGKPTDHLEAEVEKIVQELYGLTDEEVEYLCK